MLSEETRAALRRELQKSITEAEAGRFIDTLYPDTGPLRRELYVKHLEFWRAGAVHDEVAFIAANRSGKTTCVAYEDTLHLTGEYPPWWEGRRFDHPVTCWACGTDAKAVREKLQPALIGPAEARGTGMIPRDRLLRTMAKSGTADAVDFALVRHKSGGTSRLVFKAYEQGRESFQSAEVDVVQLDEEPPMAIYTEALTRTLSTVPGRRNGCVRFSFTPLEGVSEVVLQFLPGGGYPGTEELRKRAWGW
jgi:phage terminase large subunit-like protein